MCWIMERVYRIVERANSYVWRRGEYVSDDCPVVIGGCGRSGTTLMRKMIDSHPDMCCGPESKLLLPGKPTGPRISNLAERFDLSRNDIESLIKSTRSQAEFVERFFRAYARNRNASRWAEKTPNNVQSLDFIWQHFPRSKFIHMIRDGRDVACSLRHHPRHAWDGHALVPLNTNNPISCCIDRWVEDVNAGLMHNENENYCEVKYEELVSNPEAVMMRVLAFIEVPWHQGVLEHDRTSGTSADVKHYPQNPEANLPITQRPVGRWVQDLDAKEKAEVKDKAGELLQRLGYCSNSDW